MGFTFLATCKDCDKHFSCNAGGGFTHYLLICEDCGTAKGAPRRKDRTQSDTLSEHEIAHYLKNPKLWLKDGLPFNSDEKAIIDKLLGLCSCGGKMLLESESTARRRCPKCKSINLITQHSGILSD